MKTLFYALLTALLAIACDAKQGETAPETTIDTIENIAIDTTSAQGTLADDTVLERESIPPATASSGQKKNTSPQDTSKADPRITRIINEKIRPKNQDTIKK